MWVRGSSHRARPAPPAGACRPLAPCRLRRRPRRCPARAAAPARRASRRRPLRASTVARSLRSFAPCTGHVSPFHCLAGILTSQSRNVHAYPKDERTRAEPPAGAEPALPRCERGALPVELRPRVVRANADGWSRTATAEAAGTKPCAAGVHRAARSCVLRQHPGSCHHSHHERNERRLFRSERPTGGAQSAACTPRG